MDELAPNGQERPKSLRSCPPLSLRIVSGRMQGIALAQASEKGRSPSTCYRQTLRRHPKLFGAQITLGPLHARSCGVDRSFIDVAGARRALRSKTWS